MLAIVDLNGKQYQVEEGRYVTVDRLARDVDDVVELGNVLMVVDGDQTLVGGPFVDGAKIQAKVLRHFRGPKVLVYKMRCKKGYRRKNGHRQDYTQLMIDVVEFPGKVDRPKKEQAPKPERAKKAEKAEAAVAEPSEKTEKAPAEKAKKVAPKASAKTADKPKSEAKPKAPKKAKAEDAAAEPAEAPQAEAQQQSEE